ncbi:efflux transporter periplasmic adaptor subunit [Pseudoxanthomonas sangjuensis]|nr:efflux RND transporter periplasmic adaptor subunit [Pseudoxanthomonas sangjuensis]KAF1707521.1 efflux transporter periplasmic adaptor subunit [Pseudoxanthomonas sangjuensis]
MCIRDRHIPPRPRPTVPGRSSRIRRLPFLCSALLLTLVACKPQQAPQMPPPEVGVVAAKAETVPLQRDLVGRLAPFRSSDVRARVAGVLQKRLYTEGSEVRQGQPLFRIDPAPLQAALSAAQADLAAAQASYANAKVAADRARQLAPQKFVSKSDLDNAEAAERSAAAAVQQAKAGVTSARINLGYANVTAPISGRAGKQQVTEGALVGQGDATLLTTIDQIDPLYVNFSIGASELEQLRNAQGVSLDGQGKARVDVVLADGSLYPEPGLLDFSDTVVDPDTGAITLRARLPNPGKTLLPGSFVTIKATLGQRADVFLLPQAAVLRDANGAYVYVVGADGKVVRKNVAIESAGTAKWMVTSGLAANDQVVVSGQQKIKEGTPAKAVPWQPAAANGAKPQQAAAPAKAE